MIKDLLVETGAFLEGHFLLSSGKHSDGYVQCAKLLMYPDRAEKVVAEIVKKIEHIDFDMVVGPAMGGIVVCYEIARQMGKPGIFVEREDGEMALRRGFEIKPGTRVLISEDVVTTGKSSYEAADVIERNGGEVVGIACLVDRSVEELKYPLYGAIKLDLNVYDKDECPICETDLPLVKPGSRKIEG